MGRHSDTGTAKAATGFELGEPVPGEPAAGRAHADDATQLISSVPASGVPVSTDSGTVASADTEPRAASEPLTEVIPSSPAGIPTGDSEAHPAVAVGAQPAPPPRPRPVAHNPRLAELGTPQDDTTLIRSLSGDDDVVSKPTEDATDDATTHTSTAADAQARPPRRRASVLGMWLGVIVFWLLALPIGVLSAIIVAGRHATLCSKSATGLGCTSTGSVIGVVLLVILVVLVGTVSVYAFEVRRAARRWGAALGIGVGVLIIVGLVAWLIVRTIQ